MPKLDTAYLSTILNEEQRTLLRFAVHLDVPIVIDSCASPVAGKGLVAYLRAIGAAVLDPAAIDDPMEKYGEDNPAYIVLTLL